MLYSRFLIRAALAWCCCWLPHGRGRQGLKVFPGRTSACLRSRPTSRAGLVALEAPLAITADQPAADGERTNWKLTAGRRPAPAVNSRCVRQCQLAYVLRGPGQTPSVAAIESLALVDGQPAATPLPGLPVPLQDVHAAANADNVMSSGRDVADGGAAVAGVHADRPEWKTPRAGRGMPCDLASRDLGVVLTVPAAGGEHILRWTAVGLAGQGRYRAGYAGFGRAIARRSDLPCRCLHCTPHMMTFQTITARGRAAGSDASGVAMTAALDDGLLWASLPRAGKGMAFESTQIHSGKLLLRWLDWIVIVVYLSAHARHSPVFYMREKLGSTPISSVGWRSIPFWPQASACTPPIQFHQASSPYRPSASKPLAYLAKQPDRGGRLMFVAVWIVPLLRRLDLMSVFSYLETRFHPGIRMLASALCIAMQIGARMSVILFLPSLAIATITGIDVVWSILMMGVFTIIYTTLGGMKAVIWTDFVASVRNVGGAIFAIVFIIHT